MGGKGSKTTKAPAKRQFNPSQSSLDLAAAEAAVRELQRQKDALARILQINVRALLARVEFASLLKMAERRRLIAKEIVATEASYVDGLLVLIELFAVPLEELRRSKAIGIAEKDLAALFPEIRTSVCLFVGAFCYCFASVVQSACSMYNYNHDLLVRLQDRVNRWCWTTRVGDVFLELIPCELLSSSTCNTGLSALRLDLKMYTTYVNAYPAVVAAFKKHIADEPAFKAAVEHAQRHARCKHNVGLFAVPPTLSFL